MPEPITNFIEPTESLLGQLKSLLETAPASSAWEVAAYPGTSFAEFFALLPTARLPAARLKYNGSSYHGETFHRLAKLSVAVCCDGLDGPTVREMLDAVLALVDGQRLGDAVFLAKSDQAVELKDAAPGVAAIVVDFEAVDY